MNSPWPLRIRLPAGHLVHAARERPHASMYTDSETACGHFPGLDRAEREGRVLPAYAIVTCRRCLRRLAPSPVSHAEGEG